MTALDPRLTLARPDLADKSLEGHVVAARYARPSRFVCKAGKTWIRRQPGQDAPVETEILHGEVFSVLETAGGWAWGRANLDGYVGYVDETALVPAGDAPTHRVTASSTFVYAAANLKAPVVETLPFNAVLSAGPGDFAPRTGGGFVYRRHLAPLASKADDFVAVALRFKGVPYLWGGRTPLGFDCSGLVQAALLACGISAPRDTNMQQNALGHEVAVTPGLQGLKRGDLVFWKGHVGVMCDAVTLLHANAHHMAVATEPLSLAADRIERNGGGLITAIRRLD